MSPVVPRFFCAQVKLVTELEDHFFLAFCDIVQILHLFLKTQDALFYLLVPVLILALFHFMARLLTQVFFHLLARLLTQALFHFLL